MFKKSAHSIRADKARNYKSYNPKQFAAPKSNKFVDSVTDAYNERPARTENGMKARATSASAVLDFFSKAGASRGENINKDFVAAYAENPELAIRALLWLRDIKQGAGERAQFRKLVSVLERSNPDIASSLMHKIPELGRWDDLFTFTDAVNRLKAFGMIREALLDGNGLCAKWMPRKGPVAVELTRFMELTPRNYRKLIVSLTNVVETQMCNKDWDSINFSHVPSLASARYQKAFGKNAPESYSAYIHELKKPQAERDPSVKVNAGAVYPHDVVKSVAYGNAAVADEQWKALPNFLNGTRTLPIVDVSGSMGSLHYGNRGSTQPIDVAISLGLYCSDKTSSAFKDLFMTFSARPEFVRVTGSLSDKISQMSRANWDMNTNLHAAFDSLLNLATRNRVPASDMPEVLLVLSDMQFDHCTRWDDSAHEMIVRKYRQAGYETPKVVFWNLRSGSSTPVKFDTRGVCHVSGFSPAIMKTVLANDLEDYTPYNVMLKTLMNNRYDL